MAIELSPQTPPRRATSGGAAVLIAQTYKWPRRRWATVEPHVSIGCQPRPAAHKRMTLGNTPAVEKQGVWLTVGENAPQDPCPSGRPRWDWARPRCCHCCLQSRPPALHVAQTASRLGGGCFAAGRRSAAASLARLRPAELGGLIDERPAPGRDGALPTRKGIKFTAAPGASRCAACRSLSARHRSVGGTRSLR